LLTFSWHTALWQQMERPLLSMMACGGKLANETNLKNKVTLHQKYICSMLTYKGYV
jgi:hypothetical protein